MEDVGQVGRVPQEVMAHDLQAMLRGAVRAGLEVCLEAELEALIGAAWYERNMEAGARIPQGGVPGRVPEGALPADDRDWFQARVAGHSGAACGMPRLLCGTPG